MMTEPLRASGSEAHRPPARAGGYRPDADRAHDPRAHQPLIPAHLGMYAGLSIGAYAILLASVTGIQSTAEAATAADRAPLVRDVAAIGAGHDALIARLTAAKAAYESAAAAYGRSTGTLDQLQAALTDLSAAVTEISGVSQAMPATYTRPRVTSTVRTGSVPRVSATTGGSAPAP